MSAPSASGSRSPVYVLGLNAYHADVSAVLLRDGELVAAVEEERLRRIKHVAGFPAEAIRTCLRMAGIHGRDVAHVGVSRRPRAHVWRKALYAVTKRPGRRLLADRAANYRQVGSIPDAVAAALDLTPGEARPRMHWVEHHPAHLASAFFVSPFDEAAVVAIDGFGDFVSTSWGLGRGATIDVRHRTFFPHSLGVVYLALTQYLGFPAFGDEFKVMGLAPYGQPEFADALRPLIRLQARGRFELDLSYFQHGTSAAAMTWNGGEPALGRVYAPKLEAWLGPARRPDEPLTARHEAIAASLQVVFEEAAFHVLRAAADSTGQKRLCLAGGCAMNSVANGKIRTETPFEAIYVPPAASDNGTALGAATWAWHAVLGRPRSFVMEHGGWGPTFSGVEIATALDGRRADLARQGCQLDLLPSDDAVCAWTATRIAAGEVVGWFQGAMEWGARALGHRSIVADPRRADMREIINTKIKFRERFRPFAPSVAEEALDAFFLGAVADPFMMQVYPVRPEKRSVIPAVTHVDGSGRLQTVSRRTDPMYWSLIRAFERETGVPVLLNTSFNENEPIVHRPEEAIDCFLRTDMDVLVLGRQVVTKRHGERETNG